MSYQEESLAFCSGQCQASRSPVYWCRCICRGQNHGVLVRGYRSPVVNVTPQPEQYPFPEYRMINGEPVPYLLPSQAALPDKSHNRASQQTDPHTVRGINLIRSKGKYRIAKAIGRSLKHSLAGYSQDELNERILKGLRSQWNQEHVEEIINQAFVIRQSKEPDANRPELYELYETGEIDQALEMAGKRWVTGRPKK